MPADTSSEVWIAATVAALNRSGSWTGRIHIHKHLYLTKALGLAAPPFDFVLYQYGPYSYDLDSDIAQMELYGQLIKVYPSPGYGARYMVSELGAEEGGQLSAEATAALQRVANALGNSDSQSLELQATCLWVRQQENITEDTAVVQRVRQLKPKYDEVRIGHELDALKLLTGKLSVSDT